MKRELIERWERRRELKRKIREAVRAARRKKLIESVMERRETSRSRRHGLAERLHESSKLRRERLLEALKERRRSRFMAESVHERRARRLAESRFGGRRVIDGSSRGFHSREDESLDLDRKLDRKSRISALLNKRRPLTRGYEDWEDDEELDESRKERRQRIMEKIKELRSKKALKEDELDMEVQDETLPVETTDVPDELGADSVDGEELDADLLLGESKEVKADIKQLNESKRFQSLINKYLSEGVLEEAKKEEKDEEEKEDEKKDEKKECKGKDCKKDDKATAKKSVKEKVQACKECKK